MLNCPDALHTFFAARTVQAAVIFCFFMRLLNFRVHFLLWVVGALSRLLSRNLISIGFQVSAKCHNNTLLAAAVSKHKRYSSWCAWVKIELTEGREITNWNAGTVVSYFDLGWVYVQQFYRWTWLLKRCLWRREMDDDDLLSHFSASGGGGAAGPNPMPPSIGGQVYGHYTTT